MNYYYIRHKIEIKEKLCKIVFALAVKYSLSNLSFNLYQKKDVDESEYPCNQCDEVFAVKYHLSQHKKSKHHKKRKNVVERESPCNKCNFVATSNIELAKHRQEYYIFIIQKCNTDNQCYCYQQRGVNREKVQGAGVGRG